MALKIIISAKAKEFLLAEIPKDRTLLKVIWRWLERAADDPSILLEPAFPFIRPMLNFRAYDSAGKLWAATVLFRLDTPGELIVAQIRASPFPDGLDPHDFLFMESDE